MNLVLLVLAGLAGGFFAGLLGIGGGIIYILILPVALRAVGVPQVELVQYVIANSLFGTFSASLAGTVALWRKREVYLQETLSVGVAAILASLLSLHFLVNTPFYSQQIFNFVVILVLLFILVRTLTAARQVPAYSKTNPKRLPLLSFSGLAGGLVASLSGLGGGAIIVPVLNLGLRMDMHRAKSISLGVIVISALSMTIFNSFEQPQYAFSYYSTGYLVWPIAAFLSLGVIVGSPLGVRVGRILPAYALSYVFSLFILIVIGTKLWGLWQHYYNGLYH